MNKTYVLLVYQVSRISGTGHKNYQNNVLLYTVITCTALNKCPWYLLITSYVGTSLSSYHATGVWKSRGLAKPFAPIYT